MRLYDVMYYRGSQRLEDSDPDVSETYLQALRSRLPRGVMAIAHSSDGERLPVVIMRGLLVRGDQAQAIIEEAERRHPLDS